MLIRRRVVRKCLTSYPDPAASVGVSAGAKPSLLGLQAALTLQPFHSLSVKPSSGSSLGKPRSSFVQEPSCNHMQLLGWDLPVNLVFRTLFFFLNALAQSLDLGVGYLRMQLKAGILRGRALWTKMF